MVLREWPVTRAVAETLTPSTRRLATWSNSRRVQRSPLYAVPVFVLSVPLQTVQRYRRRRPDFVANQPWPTMLRPGFPKLSHPGLQHAIPSIAFIAQAYRGGEDPSISFTISEVKLTDQQRPAQAPPHQRDAGQRVVGRRVGQRLRDDHTRPIHPEMKLSPTARAVPAVFRRRPLPLAERRQPRAVDQEMQPLSSWRVVKVHVEVLPTSGERRVIGHP